MLFSVYPTGNVWWEACLGLLWMVTTGNWTPDPLTWLSVTPSRSPKTTFCYILLPSQTTNLFFWLAFEDLHKRERWFFFRSFNSRSICCFHHTDLLFHRLRWRNTAGLWNKDANSRSRLHNSQVNISDTLQAVHAYIQVRYGTRHTCSKATHLSKMLNY